MTWMLVVWVCYINGCSFDANNGAPYNTADECITQREHALAAFGKPDETGFWFEARCKPVPAGK